MNDQFIGYLGKALVPIAAVLCTFALARKYLSAASVKPPEHWDSMADLDSQFAGTQWIVGISMIVVGVVFFMSTRAALVWLNRYLSTTDGPAEFQLWPQSAIWWFFPILGALSLSWEIVLQLWSRFGSRAEAQLYNYWSAKKSGFDAPRLLRWMAVLITLPIGILTVLELHTHAALRRDDIRVCGYAFAPCKVYRYPDAQRMTMIEDFRTRDGKPTRRAGIVIDFSDGRRWSSADIGDFSLSVNPAFAEFLEKKTQLPLNYAKTEADIPRLNFGSDPQRR